MKATNTTSVPNLSEIREEGGRVHGDLQLRTACQVQDGETHQDECRQQDAAEEAYFGDLCGVLGAAELGECEHPQDDQGSDGLDHRVVIQLRPVKDVGQAPEHEIEHRDEADGDLQVGE
jgi:hypothetical protein